MSGISRRSIIQTSSLALSVPITGCSTSRLFGCSDSNAATVRTEPVEGSREIADAIRFSDLPPEQQEFVEEAVTSGEYRICPFSEAENGEHVREFAYKVEDHTSGPNRTAYLEYDGQYYALYVRILDQMFSST